MHTALRITGPAAGLIRAGGHKAPVGVGVVAIVDGTKFKPEKRLKSEGGKHLSEQGIVSIGNSDRKTLRPIN